MELKEQIDINRLPKHIAVIKMAMDVGPRNAASKDFLVTKPV